MDNRLGALDPTNLINIDFGDGRFGRAGFGAPEPVLDNAQFMGMLLAWQNGPYYECPISLIGMARAFGMSPHHASAINLKVNLLAGAFIPHKKLSGLVFRKWVKDYLSLGNAYLERIDSVTGKLIRLEHMMATYTRVGVAPDTFYWVPRWAQITEYPRGVVHHLYEPDLQQEIYGVPQWFAALQSGLLNENATLFRRKYYINGSHAGFILHVSDNLADQDAEALREALKNTKGLGNFKNLFLHTPGGKKDGVQLIPISEVAAKDEFMNIKNTTRDDILAVHRVPPQLLGVVPQHNGGFGDANTAMNVFWWSEIQPLQQIFAEVNDWLGEEVVAFKPYDVRASVTVQQADTKGVDNN